MISLERLLDGLEVAVEPFSMHGIRRNCSRDCGRSHGPTIHYAVSGSGVPELAASEAVRSSTRSVIVLPPRRRARMMPERRGREAGDPDIVIACVAIRATYQGSIGLFDNLREPLVEKLAADDPISRSFEELLDEVATLRPGSRAMAETLLRRCLILLLRRYFEHGEARLAWLAALEDTRLGRVVAAMHDRPEHAFTLPELAEVAGMSRTVFAARFTDALAQPPIEFLKRLRLARAAHLLSRTELPVKAVAAQVGYASRSSFTRAFVACHGAAPTAFRAAADELAPSPVDPVLKVGHVSRDDPGSPRRRPAA